ncbi:MAG TPA: response regulator transcription factor [Chloroflexia bacterium]|nr:response regulator transcription factor [Chloroflexia bacterium]
MSGSSTIRVLLVDDHAVVRAGLRMLIESAANLTVVGEAGNQRTALELVAQAQPDIVLLDLDLGGASSLEFLPALIAAAPAARVLILTGLSDPAQHERAVRLGAVGVVRKDQAGEVLIQAIQKVLAGEVWLDRAMIARVLTTMARPAQAAPPSPEAAKNASLTDRECDVIGLICMGLPNRQIGDRLAISETTVRHHLTSIFNKLGLSSRLELVIYAYRHGLTKPAP